MISQLMARRAAKVWCIDNSPRMVEVGTELATKNGLANLEYKLGELEQVPCPTSPSISPCSARHYTTPAARRWPSRRPGASSSPAARSS